MICIYELEGAFLVARDPHDTPPTLKASALRHYGSASDALLHELHPRVRAILNVFAQDELVIDAQGAIANLANTSTPHLCAEFITHWARIERPRLPPNPQETPEPH